MNKKKMLAAAIASLGIASVVGVGTVAAQEASGTSLAEKIATQFNLNKDEVQKVIDSDHAERHAEMQKRAEERESNRESKREEMKNKTEEERRAAMKAERDELKKWAEENNIPTQYLMFGGRGHGGPGMGGMRGDSPPSDAPAEN